MANCGALGGVGVDSGWVRSAFVGAAAWAVPVGVGVPDGTLEGDGRTLADAVTEATDPSEVAIVVEAKTGATIEVAVGAPNEEPGICPTCNTANTRTRPTRVARRTASRARRGRCGQEHVSLSAIAGEYTLCDGVCQTGRDSAATCLSASSCDCVILMNGRTRWIVVMACSGLMPVLIK